MTGELMRTVLTLTVAFLLAAFSAAARDKPKQATLGDLNCLTGEVVEYGFLQKKHSWDFDRKLREHDHI